MDRRPEHLAEDPILRADFIGQQSWDEWAVENAPFFLHPLGRQIIEDQMRAQGIDATYEDAHAVAFEEWVGSLLPDTNYSEILYLQGLTFDQRKQIVDQQHAELLRRAIELGLVEEREGDREFREKFGE